MRNLATADAEQRAADRHEQEGPQFKRVSGLVSERTAQVELRIVGGPGKVVLDVRADAPWCAGISAHETGSRGEKITYPPLHPGETFALTAHLTVEPWEGHARNGIALPLVVDVESRDGTSRTWRREVPALLEPGPFVV